MAHPDTNARGPMITVSCPACEKPTYAADDMAGQEVQCFRCRAMVTLPGPARAVAAVAAPVETAHEGPAEPPAEAPASRWRRDALYWALLLALLPLVTALFHEKDASP